MQLRDLERAIAKLPEEQRQVILLVRLEGMRYEQVAKILRIPIGTVRSRLLSGRDLLRDLRDLMDIKSGARTVAARIQKPTLRWRVPPDIFRGLPMWIASSGNPRPKGGISPVAHLLGFVAPRLRQRLRELQRFDRVERKGRCSSGLAAAA